MAIDWTRFSDWVLVKKKYGCFLCRQEWMLSVKMFLDSFRWLGLMSILTLFPGFTSFIASFFYLLDSLCSLLFLAVDKGCFTETTLCTHVASHTGHPWSSPWALAIPTLGKVGKSINDAVCVCSFNQSINQSIKMNSSSSSSSSS